MILGISLAFFLEYLDTSVKTMEDVEKSLDIPVLAVIPKGIKHLPTAGVGGHLLGVVLNHVDVRHDDNYQYYTSYNRYYTKSENGRKRVSKAVTKTTSNLNGNEY